MIRLLIGQIELFPPDNHSIENSGVFLWKSDWID